MLDALLKAIAFGGSGLLALVGIVVTLRPVTERRSQNILIVVFVVCGIGSAIAALWLSDRQENGLETKLTGGNNYVYLKADPDALKKRITPIRMWVCSTGLMFDVKIHPWPFGKYFPDPAYTSMGGSQDAFLGKGCRWASFAFPPGKFSVELEARNGLAIETIEIAATAEGPFTQACSLERDNVSLPTPECSN